MWRGPPGFDETGRYFYRQLNKQRLDLAICATIARSLFKVKHDLNKTTFRKQRVQEEDRRLNMIH